MVIVSLSCASCNSLKLIDYYYPIGEKPITKIYVYVNPNNSELNEYWKVTSNPSNKSLLTESYDSNFRLYNKFEEVQTKNGYDLINYIEYEYQGTYADQEIPSQVIEPEVYKFDLTEECKYIVKYKNMHGNFKFTKYRKFDGRETISVLNKQYETTKFKDKYFIEAIDLNDNYEFEQTTYYSKGIGMVKYERNIPNEGQRILELNEIISETEFVNMMMESSR